MYIFRKLKKIKQYFGMEPYSSYSTKDGKICFFDWWECDPEKEWFTRFIRYNFPKLDRKINFYSVFGNGKFIKKNIKGRKIFFSGENIDDDKSLTKWEKGNYCMENADLSLGFTEKNNDKYLRFPLWITYVFSPESKRNDIKKRIQDINKISYIKKYDCALIARHDLGGTRRIICDALESVLDIKYAGLWRNNTKELWEKYNNNKINYLKKFRFNICPENTDAYFYVTEKIFEAFLSGCIPIYLGAKNNPEPDIINKEAVIFFKIKK